MFADTVITRVAWVISWFKSVRLTFIIAFCWSSVQSADDPVVLLFCFFLYVFLGGGVAVKVRTAGFSVTPRWKTKVICILGLDFDISSNGNLTPPTLSFWHIQEHSKLEPTHTHTQWHTYKDMLDPPACLRPHAIVFIRGYWLAGQIFQPLAGELSNEADHFQQALGPPPPKWRPHFCSSLNCLSASAL